MHIDGVLYASVTAGYKCVNLRKYFFKESGPLPELRTVGPIRWGIALTIPMWQKLMKVGPELKASDPVLTMAFGCYDTPLDNQLDFLDPFPQANTIELPHHSPITPSVMEPEVATVELLKSFSTASTLELAPAMEVVTTEVTTELAPAMEVATTSTMEVTTMAVTTSVTTPMSTTTKATPVGTTLGKVIAKKRPAAKKLRLDFCENACTF